MRFLGTSCRSAARTSLRPDQRLSAAYFVVAPGTKACPLSPFTLLAPLAQAGSSFAAAFLLRSELAAHAEP